MITKSRSAMGLIAGCFLGSAILRVADPSNALAVEVANMAAAKAAEAAAEAPVDTFATSSNAEMGELIAALRERELQLDARANDIANRERVIEASEARLREQLRLVEEAEKKLAATLRIADRAAEKDVERLVTAFETMDSKRASSIFENMDVSFASGLISRMNGKSAADILGGLSAEKAYAISIYMVGQNAEAPVE